MLLSFHAKKLCLFPTELNCLVLAVFGAKKLCLFPAESNCLVLAVFGAKKLCLFPAESNCLVLAVFMLKNSVSSQQNRTAVVMFVSQVVSTTEVEGVGGWWSCKRKKASYKIYWEKFIRNF